MKPTTLGSSEVGVRLPRAVGRSRSARPYAGAPRATVSGSARRITFTASTVQALRSQSTAEVSCINLASRKVQIARHVYYSGKSACDNRPRRVIDCFSTKIPCYR